MLDEKLLDIVTRAVHGEKDAFEELCEEKARDILYIAIHFMENRQDGEDAAQEVLLYMQKNITNLKTPEAFNVWLYKIMRSICLNMKRKSNKKIIPFEYREKEIIEEDVEFLPYEFVEDGSKRAVLLDIINELPYKCKMCVLMFYYERLSYREIGEILQLSRKDVDNTLMKSKRIIRQKLEKEAGLKKFLTSSYALSPVPVLTAVLKAEASEMISPEAVQGLVQIIHMEGAGSSMVAMKASAGSKVPKIIMGIAIGTGVITAGVIVQNRQPSVGSEQSQSPVVVDMNEITPQEGEEPELADESPIHTLEDMIGVEEAARLRSYQEQGIDSDEEMEEFLEIIGMEPEENVWKLSTQEEDTLYLLQKQDKLLMIITRKDESERYVGVNFDFTSIGTDIPVNIEITICYEQWE